MAVDLSNGLGFGQSRPTRPGGVVLRQSQVSHHESIELASIALKAIEVVLPVQPQGAGHFLVQTRRERVHIATGPQGQMQVTREEIVGVVAAVT